jgi:SAM-dependent methyltransferase
MSELVEAPEAPSYTRMTGEIYDVIYSNKDYGEEASKVKDIIRAKCESGGNSVLEAACGTGNYMEHFAGDFDVEGFDLSHEQVEAAKRKLPNARIEQADMVDFDMGKQYDVVLCLFSSIGYLQTEENLDRAITNMAKHLKPGGVLIIEPWLKEEYLRNGHAPSLETGSNGHISVARMNHLGRDGKLTTLNLHHMVGNGGSIEHFLERHTLAMFTDQDFTDAYTKAGLGIEIDPVGFRNNRGLYIGKKPTA